MTQTTEESFAKEVAKLRVELVKSKETINQLRSQLKQEMRKKEMWIIQCDNCKREVDVTNEEWKCSECKTGIMVKKLSENMI